MGLLDKFSDLAERFAPSKISKSLGGIGSGHGMVPLEDDVSGLFCFLSIVSVQTDPAALFSLHIFSFKVGLVHHISNVMSSDRLAILFLSVPCAVLFQGSLCALNSLKVLLTS